MLRIRQRGPTSSLSQYGDGKLQKNGEDIQDIGSLPMIDSKPKRKSVAKKMMRRLNVFRKKSTESKSSTRRTNRTKSSDFSIVSNMSNSSSNRDTLLMRQQQEFEKTSLATLGAIELNSYDDRNFDTDDDDDGDDNNGLSSCGSAIRLNAFEEHTSICMEDNHSSLGYDLDSSLASSRSSRSCQDKTEVKDVAVNHDDHKKVTNDKEVKGDGADTTPHSDDLKCITDGIENQNQPSHSSSSNLENQIFDNENNERIFTLFRCGKEYYASGAYEDALQVQKEALQLIYHIAKEKDYQKNSGTDYTINFDKNLLQRQAAMVKYEIAKIKFVIYKENQYHESAAEVSPSSSSSPNYDADARLSFLFDKMQHAKCLVSIQDFVYYRDQLAIMDQENFGCNPSPKSTKKSAIHNTADSADSAASANNNANITKQNQQQTNNNCKLSTQTNEQSIQSFDTKKIAQKIEILNALGKLCHKDLHQYEDALRYHCEALELECAIVAFLIGHKNDENATCTSALDVAEEIQEWKMKIQQTKKKMGAIYYLSGRFDMALLSSFSFQSHISGSVQSAGNGY